MRCGGGVVMADEVLGRGLAFPLRVGVRGLAESAGVARVEESIRIILGTQHGERMMRPQFGANLRSLVFAPNNATTANLARYYVTDALARWEPRIDVLDVLVSNDLDTGGAGDRDPVPAAGHRPGTSAGLSLRAGACLMTLESRRGRIVPPDLDDRTWQDLVDQMRALIPKYAPQWTDHNPSDLGITLIELFAWLGEGIIYRLNQMPEKNYLAFLNLLGITRDPPAPARTYLTFTSGVPAPVTVPAGTQAQTADPAGGRPVVFETDEDVAVLPTVLKAALQLGPRPTGGAGGGTYRNVSAGLIGPPTASHLIEVPPGQTVAVYLGFDRAVTAEPVDRPAPVPGAPGRPLRPSCPVSTRRAPTNPRPGRRCRSATAPRGCGTTAPCA